VTASLLKINLLTETKLLLSRENVKEMEFGVMPEFEHN
jgi:hypothetical protein